MSTRGVRRIAGIGVLLLVLALALIASVAIGNRFLAPGFVWHTLTDHPSLVWDSIVGNPLPRGYTEAEGIVIGHRLPRTLLGLVVGLAIGAAGALTQGHTRNPLADPGILGVNAGAACAVVLGVFTLGISTPLAFMGFGMLGAVIAAVVVFGLASLSGASPLTLVLAGTGVSALLMAISSGIVLSDGASLDTWRFWNVGSTAGRSFDVFRASVPFIVFGLVIALASGFFLNLLSLGDDMSKSLGGRVVLIRVAGVAAITLLIGAATAACGPIVFLGLVVPHIARAFTGPDYRWVIPYSALLGAILMLVADVIGRVIARPEDVQVAVVLAMIGAPFLIAMVRRQKLATV
ncbi:putative iron-siderophore ABC transporter permease protein [Gordonia effusa NBRC 100432]|uniref:Putative iron-siderophore ABC transporter permease protein n=1 Tax=Gordonia effusa NBRC 100432 TaxID=1077974 RepID=H0R284_9ACTN|nr:putative iron-siderophore ABC transporter permease protein [Gordonia effusa NBRC 100432]